MSELCAWCKNTEALPYERYNGCCGLHCRDLMECDKLLTQRDKRIREFTKHVEGLGVLIMLNHTRADKAEDYNLYWYYTGKRDAYQDMLDVFTKALSDKEDGDERLD